MTMHTRTAARARGVGPLLLGSAALAAMLSTASVASAAMAPDSFAELAAKATPAVVNIATTEHVRDNPEMQGMPFDFPEGSPFEKFFEQFQGRQGQRQAPDRQAQALGSGFIIDPAGYVVTNNHVIDDAEKIQVTLADGRQFPAKLVGTDEKTDLALLKVESDTPLPAVAFGDSDETKVGDWVMAVGNPFGLGGTVTTGIVSARSRDIHSGPFDDFLQIDASINQGNSGGPTFDMDGKVIGINSAIATPNGGSVGIGFAIPANLAKPVIAALREQGHVQRGWLGVRIQAVTPDLAEAMGLDELKGALVADVDENGPAHGKLEVGDVILAFDGAAIDELRDLPRLVAAAPVDRSATIDIWRDHAKESVTVEIAKLQDDQNVADNGTDGNGGGLSSTAVLGLHLAKLDAKARQAFGIDQTVSGVVITDVDGNSKAAEEGLRPGDVIREVGQVAVETPAEIAHLVEEAQKKDAKSVLMLINRDGDDLFLAMNIAEA